MKKYSDWFKVDLHIHTDYSKQTKTNDYQGLFDINVLKQKLIDNDVKLFSLTDHNIINVDAYKNYYENYIDGDPKLLIGCEFDIEVPESGKTITYHSVIVFENDNIEDVEKISSKIEELYTNKGGLKTERKITIDDLYDLFNEHNYFFIPHAGNTKSILDPYIGYDMKLCQQMVLLMPSAFEKVRESVRQTYNEGFDRIKTLDFQHKDDIPYINFSDNHNCNSYPCTNKKGDNHEFYCIKGQPTFESIRFAFIDPKSRIKKFSEVEVLMRFDNFLHSIQFENNPVIKNTTLYFSPNLNTIIGGRSSGKSLLFNILGKKINNNKSQIDKYALDITNAKVKSFLDDDYKSIINYNRNDIIYINQGDIVNYFENNSLKDLIHESGETENYKASLEFFKTKKLDLTKLVEGLIELYSELYDVLNSNFTFHDRDITSVLDSSYIFKGISNIEDNTASFQTSSDVLSQLVDNIEKFKSDENWAFSPEELETIKLFTDLVESKSFLFDKVTRNYNKKVEFIEDVKQVISNKNSNLDLKGREKEASNQRLTILNKNIFNAFKIAKAVETHCSLFENLVYGGTQEIIINSEVAVVLEVESRESIKEKIIEGLGTNSSSSLSLSLYQVLIKLALGEIKIKNLPTNSSENLAKKTQTQIKSILDLFDKPIEYLKYSEKSTSKNNSPGFNSEKYLQTILKSGNSKIIFIDQPEDNLGNRFITEKLIDLIRDLKFKKQIFLVTHNPSIVVYGDAENIIMCVNNENKIEYEQFVLEEKEHQKEICTVLDGGQYIFEQRARKYNIKKLIQ
jgi:ABC-type lipoprotein export system ATPase subunit